MASLPGDWRHLGRYLRHEIHTRGSTPREFAVCVGISYNSLTDLLAGKPRQRWPRYLAALEHALGWAPGDVERVLDHQEPLRTQPSGASLAEVEAWIWAHDSIPEHHRRALIASYRAILELDRQSQAS